MDMNRSFFLRKEKRDPRWHVIDAEGKVVGRLATEIADKLRGKDEAFYTPHTDSGDYVVVINADKVIFTGDKMTDKEYVWFTGWKSGQRKASPAEKMQRDPAFIITHAVKGMLPKNHLARDQIKRLKVYAGQEHPHKAQIEGFNPETGKSVVTAQCAVASVKKATEKEKTSKKPVAKKKAPAKKKTTKKSEK